MANEKVIRWGIIGAGSVCEMKSGPAFYKAKNSQLLAVMRRDSVKAEDFAKRHNVPHWYTQPDDIFGHAEIDAVYIATPPAFHKEYAIAAMEAGKYVYIEKPVTRNATECDDIISCEKRTNSKVCVAHYRRFLPSFTAFADLMRNGAIGKPLMANIELLRPAARTDTNIERNWRVNPVISGGGIFHDLAPHQLDLMLQWFGKIVKANGLGHNQRQLTPADDSVHGWALFESGVILQGRWHFATNERHARDFFEVIGTEGKLSMNFFGDQIITLENGSGIKEIRSFIPEHIQQPLIEQINAYFRGERNNPSSVIEAKAVMGLMDILSAH